MMALVEALMFNCGNFDGPLRHPVYLSHAQAVDMERSLPPLPPRCDSFCGALELLVFWHGSVAVACLVPLGHEGHDWAYAFALGSLFVLAGQPARFTLGCWQEISRMACRQCDNGAEP
jgi:hypothetical protein